MSVKQTQSARALVASDEESLTSVEDSSSEESPDSSVKLQLGTSVYDDAWLAPIVGLYGARGRKHQWQCSLLLLVVNLVIQGMLLVRIGGTGGLLDEARAKAHMLVHEHGETETADGICELSPSEEFDNTSFPRGVPPLRVGETKVDCVSLDADFTYGFSVMDLDDDGNWTFEEAAAYKEEDGYEVDAPTIQANMLNTLRKAALAVKQSGRFAASAGALHQAQALLDQLARRNDSITREVFETQVEPFSLMCEIGDPLLCGNFFLRGALNRTKFLEPLRSRGFEGLPLLFVANNWMGSDEVHVSMFDVCKVATERICPSILSNREVQFRAIIKDFCGAPSFGTHEADVSGIPNSTILATSYAASEVYEGTVLTKTYIGFLGLILMFWILSMLDEFNQLVTWWRVHCGLLCCSGPSRGQVRCEDGAIEVVSVPKWYIAMALLTNVVPRSAIFFALTALGTQFLLTAASFQDLIMNGVALTFLITVDEIMFAAVVPSERKEWIDEVKPVAPPPQPRCDRVLRHFVNEVFWIGFIAAALAAILCYEYARPSYGKLELARATECVCEGGGRGCQLARLAGGYPHVPTAVEAAGS